MFGFLYFIEVSACEKDSLYYQVFVCIFQPPPVFPNGAAWFYFFNFYMRFSFIFLSMLVFVIYNFTCKCVYIVKIRFGSSLVGICVCYKVRVLGLSYTKV